MRHKQLAPIRPSVGQVTNVTEGASLFGPKCHKTRVDTVSYTLNSASKATVTRRGRRREGVLGRVGGVSRVREGRGTPSTRQPSAWVGRVEPLEKISYFYVSEKTDLTLRKNMTKDFARVYGSEARVDWIRGLPCLGCGRGPCENAHTATGGMGRKAGAETIVPLCQMCHHVLHQHGVTTFERNHGWPDGWLKEAAMIVQVGWEKRMGVSL